MSVALEGAQGVLGAGGLETSSPDQGQWLSGYRSFSSGVLEPAGESCLFNFQFREPADPLLKL